MSAIPSVRHFLRSIRTDAQGRDAIDRELDDALVEDPWPEVNPSARRKDSELQRVLDILANLPRGKDSE